MSRIIKCPVCGYVTESFRPSRRECNHNQDEEGTPVPLAQMIEVDPVQAVYVKAWIAYHLAADEVDGGRNLIPQTAQEMALFQQAIRVGIDAQVAVMRRAGQFIPVETEARVAWNRANRIATRILGKEWV